MWFRNIEKFKDKFGFLEVLLVLKSVDVVGTHHSQRVIIGEVWTDYVPCWLVSAQNHLVTFFRSETNQIKDSMQVLELNH